MLKTLKWVYSLGVKQERQRIARELEYQASALDNQATIEHDMLREMSNNAKTRKQRLELRHATTIRVQEIISTILKPQYISSTSASIMFPDDAEKK